MDNYIAYQPIISTKKQKTVAYELIYRQDSGSLYNQDDQGAASSIVSFLNQLEGSSFLAGRDVLLTFTPNLLMKNIPDIFDVKKLIVQIEDNVLIHPETLGMLHRYKERGYRMALVGFTFNNRNLDILPHVDYLKVNFERTDDSAREVKSIISLAQNLNKKTIAYNVNSPEARGKALVLGFDYIQGESVADMLRGKTHKMEKLNSVFYQLLSEISAPQPEFGKIERLVSMDVNLTYSLLKMVNSAYFALPNRIKEVRQALTILGLSQLRQWVYLLSFVPDAGLSEELIKTSFLRAIFCQKLSGFIPHFPISSEEAYLLGMFSTLDALLDVPQEEAVKQLPLSDELKEGLMGRPGQCSELLNLCVAYEKGHWTKMGRFAQNLGVPTHIISKEYFDSIEHVNGIWSSVMRRK
jgi:EAL and modified HD-GYP domain-containing signal transduction protein